MAIIDDTVMKKMLSQVVICLSLIGWSNAQCQSKDYPVIGSKCPNFSFEEVHYYKKNNVELNDFKGKWLILYFWNQACCTNGWCDSHFSEVNDLQNQYKKDVQFLFVGYTGSQYSYVASEEKFIKQAYTNTSKNNHFNLPIAYDSSLFHRFDIGACPYLVIIDPHGIVQGITYELKKADLSAFLKGQRPILAKAYRTHEDGSFYADYKHRVFPEVGKECPDFVFHDVSYNPERSLKLSDYRGKWLVIDCWHRWCIACIKSFPATDSMQKRFGDSIRFLLVGNTGTSVARMGADDKEIRKLYSTLKERDHLDLPVAFDSVFFRKNDIGACPYIIVVDPAGIVRGITSKVTEHDMYAFMHGGSPEIDKAYRTHEEGNTHMKMSPIVEK